MRIQTFRKPLQNTLVSLAGMVVAGAFLCSSGRAQDLGSRSTTSSPDAAATKTSSVTVHEGKVQANGITIAYESFGPVDRETILMIMGQGAPLTAWPDELCEELVKRGYRVIIFDNRDVGLSTRLNAAGKPDLDAIMKARSEGKPAPMAYTLDDMAKDAVGLLDALGIKQAHIVGVSMGGMIAQLIAADHPEHTLSLTSIMASSGNLAIPLVAKPEAFKAMPQPAPPGDRAAMVANTIKLSRILAGRTYPPDEKRLREVIERTMKRSSDGTGMERHMAAAAVGYYDDRRVKLKTIKVPAVVLHGAEDPLVPVEGGRDVAANIPGADLRIIPGMGHDLPVALVNSFCRKARPSGAPRTGHGCLAERRIVMHCYALFLIVICAGGMPGGPAQSRAGKGEIRPLVRRPHCYFIVINNGRPVHLLPSSQCQTARSAVAATRVFLARTARDRRPSGPSPGGRFLIANLCSIITLRSQ